MNLYGLIIGIALVIGIDFFTKHNRHLSPQKRNLYLFGLLLSLFIGARLYHVIDQWSFYSQNLILIPQTWQGGMGIYGALIAAIIYTLFFAKLNHIYPMSLFDSFTPILPLCQSIGRIGNFVNHEIPSWYFEASLNLLLFFVIRKSKNPTALYLIGYGTIRFIMEFFRNDTWQIKTFKVAQIISLAFILLGFFLLKKFRRIGD